MGNILILPQKDETESAKYCQKNAKFGQKGTKSSWSEIKKEYLFPLFPVKCEFSFQRIYRTKFDAFSHIDNIFDNLKMKFFDIDKLPMILKILIYRPSIIFPDISLTPTHACSHGTRKPTF